eukprot:1066409-Pyramimonas_sp.AAC.1
MPALINIEAAESALVASPAGAEAVEGGAAESTGGPQITAGMREHLALIGPAILDPESMLRNLGYDEDE